LWPRELHLLARPIRSPDLGDGGERNETGCVEHRQPDCQRHQNDVYFAEGAVEATLPGAVEPSSVKGGAAFAGISPANEAWNRQQAATSANYLH